ncbi:MAG: TetR/AcrR family transcriptional regulator [Actinomycetes bacterium]|jgi:AcrR family transcriptional regulator
MSTDRRRQILDVALKAFSTSGYHNTSMTDIADALSMTKPVVYQYFDSKRELYLELLHEVSSDLVTSVTAVLTATGEPRAQVENGLVAYFTWVANNPDAFSLLFDSSERVDVEVDDIVSEFEDSAAKAIAPFITADISADDQHTFAIGIVGMVETVSRQVIGKGQTFDPEQLGRSVADLLWGGLRSIGQSRNTQPR